jgi:hypothetical protein
MEAKHPSSESLLQEGEESKEVLGVPEELRRMNRVAGEVEVPVGKLATKDPRHAIEGMQSARAEITQRHS